MQAVYASLAFSGAAAVIVHNKSVNETISFVGLREAADKNVT
jgi:hypothetical protein